VRAILALSTAFAIGTFNAPTQPAAGTLTLSSFSIVRTWVDAVRRHHPGEPDSATFVPAGWSRSEVQQAWVDVQVLGRLLHNHTIAAGEIRIVQAGNRVRVQMADADLAALRTLAEEIQRTEPADDFLKRAAVLHTDTVQFASQDAADPTGDLSLLTPRRVMVQTEDGKQHSMRTGAVHWEFARVLLDQVTNAGDDTFIRDWYRATMKLKLAIAEMDAPHFEHGLRVLPRDAEVRFLLGCLHEALADPRVQAVRKDMERSRSVQLLVQEEDDELTRARSFFRSALSIDPRHAEARLRLGWTLYRLGQSQEAVTELQHSTDLAREAILRYFGFLFLGSALERVGRQPDAQRAFENALSIYPNAQAPRLGLSQLAHRRGQRARAEAVLREVMLPAATKSRDADPWWQYHSSAGRRAEEELQHALRLAARTP
jgi:tetratricopeptide (TPR) repeat protein